MKLIYFIAAIILAYAPVNLGTTLTPKQAAQREKETVHTLQTPYLQKLQEAISKNNDNFFQDLQQFTKIAQSGNQAVSAEKMIGALSQYNLRNTIILSGLIQALDPKSLVALNQKVLDSLDRSIKLTN